MTKHKLTRENCCRQNNVSEFDDVYEEDQKEVLV